MFFLFLYLYHYLFFFFFKQKTAYELRISDWSSDVCSSDLKVRSIAHPHLHAPVAIMIVAPFGPATLAIMPAPGPPVAAPIAAVVMPPVAPPVRSEEHTSELQSLMRISYAVFCLQKKKLNKEILHQPMQVNSVKYPTI